MGSVKNTPRSTLMVLLAAGLFVTYASDAAPVAKKSSANQPSEIHRSKSVKNYAEQDKILEKARKLLSEEKYAEAVTAFEEVLAILELEISAVDGSIARARHAQVKGEIFNARRAWGASLMQTARVAAAEKRYNDAIRLASEAAVRDVLLKDDAERLTTFCHGMIRNDKLESDQGIKKYEAEIKAKTDRIKRLLAEANTLYKAKDFIGAIGKVESIYLLDPTNMDAIELAGRAYRKLYDYAPKRNLTAADRAMAVTEWQWIEPVFEITGQDKSDDAVTHSNSDVSGAEKLDKIIFPSFVFDEADLPAVIEYLQSRSKQYDADGVGVVIENNLPPGADQVTVTMSLSNVPLSTVLRVLCLKASEWSEIFRDGIKYTVSDNGRRVTLASAAAQTGMEERIFSVPDILYRMVKGEGGGVVAPVEAPAASEGDAPAEGGDAEAASTETAAAPAPSSASSAAGRAIPGTKWIECFKSWLIPFPAGSSVFHDAVRGEITVRNTPENLRLLDVVLGQISSLVDPLVMIEIKAIEISESDYQELGFDWAIANTGIQGVDTVKGIAYNNGSHHNWILAQGVNTLVGGAAPITRALSTPIVKNWNIFGSLFGTQTPFGSEIPFTVNLTINALSKSDRTETVSAPKIITKATPGQGDDNRAIVNMGKSYYFPESWEELEVDIETSGDDTATVNITPPQPDFGDSTFVGMEFNVKPRLLSDNKTLEVQLKVNASSYAVIEGSEDMPEDKWNIHVKGQKKEGNTWVPFDYVYPIFQPRFYKRNLDVITNIYDGDTIVVGGMVEAQSQTVNDKIPFLGDLPLIGRLFQSSSETVKRTNMLIFLSARLMKNDGTPLNAGKPTGLPDFNR